MSRFKPLVFGAFVWAATVTVHTPAARAFDSRCYLPDGRTECKPGPQSARDGNRWMGPVIPAGTGRHSAEHQALLKLALDRSGLPPSVGVDFTILSFTGSPTISIDGSQSQSYEPVMFVDARTMTRRTQQVSEFAQLPDLSYALWDWVRGNETCPLPVMASPESCHDFGTHMGPVNSNHFGPQAANSYSYYHKLARDRADVCHEMRTRARQGLPPGSSSSTPTPARFTSYIRACEKQALLIEAAGQHFLQDAWSSGHMWERWGSPDLQDFALPVDAMLVALTSGLIHGARGVLLSLAPFVDWNDALCAPNDLVRWVGTDASPPQHAVGDLYIRELFGAPDGPYQPQLNQLMSCSIQGLRDVYERSGREHGDPGAPSAVVVQSVDLSSAGNCFGQRVTNLAFDTGMGVDLVDPTSGFPTNIPMTAEFVVRALPVAATVIADSLFSVIVNPGALGARTHKYRLALLDLTVLTTARRILDPQATDLASGGPSSFLGVLRNGHEKYIKTPPSTYADPILPWNELGPERAQWLARAFHEAHATDWCNHFDSDRKQLKAFRDRVGGFNGSGEPARDAALAVCVEFAKRALRFGRNEGSYNHNLEPLCFYLADTPSRVEFVYYDGPETDVETAAGAWCLPESPDGGSDGGMMPDPDSTDAGSSDGGVADGPSDMQNRCGDQPFDPSRDDCIDCSGVMVLAEKGFSVTPPTPPGCDNVSNDIVRYEYYCCSLGSRAFSCGQKVHIEECPLARCALNGSGDPTCGGL